MEITLKKLPKATAQQVFDYVVSSLFAQGQKSLNDNYRCQYRATSRNSFGEEETLKCAAGWLIADNEYDKAWENSTWAQLAEHGNVPKKHKKLIAAMQRVHDQGIPRIWAGMFRALAKEFKLNSSILDDLHLAL